MESAEFHSKKNQISICRISNKSKGKLALEVKKYIGRNNSTVWALPLKPCNFRVEARGELQCDWRKLKLKSFLIIISSLKH